MSRLKDSSGKIAAVVVAAGMSRRMGKFKQLLPWDEGVVIQQVVSSLQQGGAAPVLCVVGHRHDEVELALADREVCCIFNPEFACNEMLDSMRLGISALEAQTEHHPIGTLLALGDQPHIPAAVIRAIVDRAEQLPNRIVIPSVNMRRGHPIFMPRWLWPAMQSLAEDQTLRDLLAVYESHIEYVVVEHESVRTDMDHPQQYQALRRRYDASLHRTKQDEET